MSNLEKRISLIILILFCTLNLFAQKSISTKIRFKIWYSMDTIPGDFIPQESLENLTIPLDTETSGYKYSISQIHKILPFILEGQIYGWNFIYTPSDKKRAVSEYFEFTPVQEIKISDSNILYDSPAISDTGNTFSCWISYKCTDYQISLLQSRESVSFLKISGIGNGILKNETEGIREAFTNAAKNAIREYYRTIILNKPKQISGTVYLIGTPRYYVDSGKYVADLDFYLKKGTILYYTHF